MIWHRLYSAWFIVIVKDYKAIYFMLYKDKAIVNTAKSNKEYRRIISQLIYSLEASKIIDFLLGHIAVGGAYTYIYILIRHITSIITLIVSRP